MRSFVLILALLISVSLSSCVTRVATRPSASLTVVKTLPKHYKIVSVNGRRYYFWNGKHYRKTRQGYVLVRV